MNKNNQLVLLVVLLYAYNNIKFVSTCYITNCPWGGKRSIEEASLFKREHQVVKQQKIFIPRP